MATTAASVVALTAQYICDVWLTIGTNDISTTDPETIIANIRKYHNMLRTNGVRFLILMNIDPRNGLAAASYNRLISANAAYLAYCQSVPDAFYCDTTAKTVLPTATDFSLISGLSNDGLHFNGGGLYAKHFGIRQLAEQLYRKRGFQQYTLGDLYNATDAIRGNKQGTNGRCVSIGGTQSITNSGTGSITGTPPLGWVSSGAIDGTFGITFTQENCTSLDTYAGTSGAQCVRMAFTGAPATSISLNLTRGNTINTQLNTIPMRGSLLINFNALTGGVGITHSTIGLSTNPSTTLWLGSTPVASDVLPQLDGLHELDWRTIPVTNFNGSNVLALRFFAGQAVSGSIDIIGSIQRRDDAVPAASP